MWSIAIQWLMSGLPTGELGRRRQTKDPNAGHARLQYHADRGLLLLLQVSAFLLLIVWYWALYRLKYLVLISLVGWYKHGTNREKFRLPPPVLFEVSTSALTYQIYFTSKFCTQYTSWYVKLRWLKYYVLLILIVVYCLRTKPLRRTFDISSP